MQARQLDVRYDDDDEQSSVDMTTGVVPTVEAFSGGESCGSGSPVEVRERGGYNFVQWT